MLHRIALVTLLVSACFTACATPPAKPNPQIDPLEVAQEHVELLQAGETEAALVLVRPDHRAAYQAAVTSGRFSRIPKRFELLLRSIGETQAIIEIVGTRYEFDLKKIDGKWWMQK